MSKVLGILVSILTFGVTAKAAALAIPNASSDVDVKSNSKMGFTGFDLSSIQGDRYDQESDSHRFHADHGLVLVRSLETTIYASPNKTDSGA